MKERSDGLSFNPADKTTMGKESAHRDKATIQLHHEEKEQKEKLGYLWIHNVDGQSRGGGDKERHEGCQTVHKQGHVPFGNTSYCEIHIKMWKFI